jgi:hypothetical protein
MGQRLIAEYATLSRMSPVNECREGLFDEVSHVECHVAGNGLGVVPPCAHTLIWNRRTCGSSQRRMMTLRLAFPLVTHRPQAEMAYTRKRTVG